MKLKGNYMTEKAMTFEPLLGTEIEKACRQAVEMARQNDCKVEFQFNDVDLVAYATDTGADVAARWYAERESRKRKYLSSPEYAEQKRQREAEVARKQRQVDRLLTVVECNMTQDAWMQWVAELTDVADDVGVKVDWKKLGQDLRKHGWIRDDHVTDDPEIKKRLAVNKTMMAEYIIGQVISFMDSGMPPHPVAISFVEKYKAI